MCKDAELATLDDYAREFVSKIRDAVLRWGLTTSLTQKQEDFLMTLATNGLRVESRRRRSSI